MLARATLVGLLGASVLLSALAAAAVASGAINVRAPEDRRPVGAAEAPLIKPPSLAPPPAQATYVPHPAVARVAAPDGRPVAQLPAPPAALPEVAVSLPPRAAAPAGQVAYAVLASVRYAGGGHRMLVTTATLSPAAAERPAVLGSKTVRLADGTTAYATVGLPGEMPNQVVQVRDDLIVTVGGDLPLEQLEALMAQVVVRR